MITDEGVYVFDIYLETVDDETFVIELSVRLTDLRRRKRRPHASMEWLENVYRSVMVQRAQELAATLPALSLRENPEGFREQLQQIANEVWDDLPSAH